MSSLILRSTHLPWSPTTIRMAAAITAPLLLALVGLAIAVGLRLAYALSVVNSI